MSLLSRLRGRQAHQALTGTDLTGRHPRICRCEGHGVLPDAQECPMVWTSHVGAEPRWLVGRVVRGSHR